MTAILAWAVQRPVENATTKMIFFTVLGALAALPWLYMMLTALFDKRK